MSSEYINNSETMAKTEKQSSLESQENSPAAAPAAAPAGPPQAAPGGPGGPPRGPTVHLHHPSLFPLHFKIIKQSLFMLFMLALVVFGILSIYWGSCFGRDERAKNLNVWVLNFDNDLVGNSVVDAIRPLIGQPDQLGWQIIDASTYQGDVQTVFDDIVDEKAWGAITIASNATRTLREAAENRANVSSDYLVRYLFNDGRQETASYEFMLPFVQIVETQWTEQFSSQWVNYLTSNLSDSDFASLAREAPSTVGSPISFTYTSVRPYGGNISPAILITGLIYIIIISFFQIPHFIGIHMIMPGKVSFIETMIHRFCLNGAAMFILSLLFSLLSLAFQADFSAKYGHGGFVVYWMINFMSMWALGGASENMIGIIMAVFPPAMGYWLIFWVVTNAATSFAPLELSPGFYQFGKAFPIHNTQQAIRTVLFNTKSHMGVNFAVFTTWIVVNFLFSFVSARFIMYWKGRAARKAAAASKA